MVRNYLNVITLLERVGAGVSLSSKILGKKSRNTLEYLILRAKSVYAIVDITVPNKEETEEHGEGGSGTKKIHIFKMPIASFNQGSGRINILKLLMLMIISGCICDSIAFASDSLALLKADELITSTPQKSKV